MRVARSRHLAKVDGPLKPEVSGSHGHRGGLSAISRRSELYSFGVSLNPFRRLNYLQEHVESAAGDNIRKMVWRSIGRDARVFIYHFTKCLHRGDDDDIRRTDFETEDVTVLASPC